MFTSLETGIYDELFLVCKLGRLQFVFNFSSVSCVVAYAVSLVVALQRGGVAGDISCQVPCCPQLQLTVFTRLPPSAPVHHHPGPPPFLPFAGALRILTSKVPNQRPLPLSLSCKNRTEGKNLNKRSYSEHVIHIIVGS